MLIERKTVRVSAMTAGTESTALNESATVTLVAEMPPVWDPMPSTATNVSTTHTRTSTDAALATATGTEMTVAYIWEYVTDLAHGATAQDPMTVLPVTNTHNFRLPDDSCLCDAWYSGIDCTSYVGECDNKCDECFGATNKDCVKCVYNAFLDSQDEYRRQCLNDGPAQDVICQEYYVPIIAFFATTIWKTSWMQMRFAYDELTEGISMGQLASHVTQDAKHALEEVITHVQTATPDGT
jgi:hypothetical protein